MTITAAYKTDQNVKNYIALSNDKRIALVTAVTEQFFFFTPLIKTRGSSFTFLKREMGRLSRKSLVLFMGKAKIT